MKIHLIGIPSAGKTTLGAALSKRLGIPHYPLDELAFVDDRWTLRQAAERDDMLNEILAQPSFITEGGFLGWTDELFAASDLILWLDPPLHVLVWRHVRRFKRDPWWIPSLLRFQIQSYRRPIGAGPAKDDPDQTSRHHGGAQALANQGISGPAGRRRQRDHGTPGSRTVTARACICCPDCANP